MRSLMIDIYRIGYAMTKGRVVAIILGVVYLTTLNLITIKGIGLLMEGLLPMMASVRKLFTFPYAVITVLAVMGITLWVMPPLSAIVKESKKKSDSWALLAYSLFSVLLFVYMRM